MYTLRPLVALRSNPSTSLHRFLSRHFSSSSSAASTEVRVRFAPSPTGHLHLGGLRTALYNYLFARKHDGRFILRVEDTDQTRVVPGALEALIRDLQWTGITIDEGPGSAVLIPNENGAGKDNTRSYGPYGPYVQSERVSIYKEKSEEIVERGGAYKCFCTEHRLELMRKDAARRNEHFRGYDNRCRHLSSSEISSRLRDKVPFVIRLRLEDVAINYDDAVFGPHTDNVSQREGDPILLKTDGFPTYHFANVVDDHLMRVTHVLRGAEWISSTPKHVTLYNALGWKPPCFAHLPLIMNSDGKKLSKRHDHLRVSSLRDSGYTPETLLTFLCSIGGGILPRESREFGVHTLESLVEAFDLDHLSRSPGNLNFDFLNFYARSHLQDLLSTSSGRDYILRILKKRLIDSFHDPSSIDAFDDDEELLRILRWSSDRIFAVKGLIDDPDLNFVWRKPRLKPTLIASSLNKQDVSFADAIKLLENVKSVILKNDDLTILNGELRVLAKKGRKPFLPFKDLMGITRWCLMGSTEGPPVFEVIDIVGKGSALERLDLAMEFLADCGDGTTADIVRSADERRAEG